MISGIDLNATVDYTLKEDKENPTVWKLGVVSPIVWAKISNFDAESMDGRVLFLIKAVQHGLKGWQNFNMEFKTGKEIIYDAEVEKIPIDIIKSIPMNVITELGLKIIEINTLTPLETKN